MSRDPATRPDDTEPDGSGPREPGGQLGTTRAGAVVGWALAGLVLGWLVRPVSVRLSGTAPTVSWLPVLALLFVAAVVGSVAWSTYRLLHRRHERLQPHHAVNRLVLAKSCALAGALVAGGYFGYALSWLGLTEAALARQRVVHALLAGVAGILLVVGSLLLERACRVSRDDR
jgi:MFS family permease